jgi:predicted acylesterase/phospholipase RssA
MTASIVPAPLVDQARVLDIDGIRFWGDGDAKSIAGLLQHEAPVLRAKYAHGVRGASDILAISGGADDGAFSAGLVVGWGIRGNRPAFDIVTGISVGALVAPFAFLGSSYDRQLATLFTEHADDEIYRANPVAGVLGGSAIADNTPLAKLIAKYVDRRMLNLIAKERAKGRLLLIGTTNLNAQRPVVWDMGRIAQAGTKEALELFRQILLASAAVPGVFPPVPITVVAGGKTYQEIHVDGGPTREVFLSPGNFSFRQIDAVIGRPIQRRVWVIKNGILEPVYADVPLTAPSIAVRSLETLTKYQGMGDLTRIYLRAKGDGMDFNLASIPATFAAPRSAPFAKAYMTALYNTGVQLGRTGYSWSKAPPEQALRVQY